MFTIIIIIRGVKMDNKKLKIIIFILLLTILGLTSYIVYDKVQKNDEISNIKNETAENKNDEEKTNNENEEDIIENKNDDYNNEITDLSLINELTNVFKFVYDYFDSGNAYCGGFKYTERIYSGDNPNGYYESITYRTYNEMIEDLKNYMSENVIYKRYNTEEEYKANYIEQDNKLYCGDFGKGGNIYQPENIVIKNSKQQENKIITTIELELSTMNDGPNIFDNYEVSFEKYNNKWIIISYENKK